MKQEFMMLGDDDDKSFEGNEESLQAMLQLPSFSSSLPRDVNYSCGSCGYELNLSSLNRNTSAIGAKYGKSIKRGIITFFTIDETRFIQKNKLQYLPYFSSKQNTWSLFQRCIELLCKNCGNHIGIAYKGKKSIGSTPLKLTWDGISGYRIYDIKICSLTPSSHDKSGLFIDTR
ncbi:hypothetical protein Leryth_008127 [Lithospermum erythrorhizon]|nr:hypothetical protein Leryth_008127 [Lithospermum erythrorhizon]